MLLKSSIQVKFTIILIFAVLLVAAGFVLGVQDLKLKQLRNEAKTVAEQVVSFRTWMENSDLIWVRQLTPDFHDYLGVKMLREGEKMFSKNPDLATRELSTVVSKSSAQATFRVTSDNFRSPANEPDSFEKMAVNKFKGDEEISFVENIEDGKYRYAQPIYVKTACLNCHGDPKDAPIEIIEKYGNQRAFGYKVGDVRGIISVTLPDIEIDEVISSFINPATIGLIAVAFLVSYLYIQFGLISRMKNLTAKTIGIAKGDLNMPIEVEHNSLDEINHISHAVDMLRNSLIIAMRLKEKER